MLACHVSIHRTTGESTPKRPRRLGGETGQAGVGRLEVEFLRVKGAPQPIPVFSVLRMPGILNGRNRLDRGQKILNAIYSAGGASSRNAIETLEVPAIGPLTTGANGPRRQGPMARSLVALSRLVPLRR